VEEGGIGEDVLDMPTPWSPKLYIKKDSPEEMCGAAQKTVYYLKSKVEIFAPYTPV
jgi:hypothetical protein